MSRKRKRVLRGPCNQWPSLNVYSVVVPEPSAREAIEQSIRELEAEGPIDRRARFMASTWLRWILEYRAVVNLFEDKSARGFSGKTLDMARHYWVEAQLADLDNRARKDALAKVATAWSKSDATIMSAWTKYGAQVEHFLEDLIKSANERAGVSRRKALIAIAADVRSYWTLKN